MGLAETQLSLGHAYCEGTPSHQKDMEKITNACFLEASCTSPVLRLGKRSPKNTPNKGPEPKGCAVAITQGRIPTVIPYSVKLPIVVKASLWNCLAGNTANLLHTIGHYDGQMDQMMKLLQNNGSHFNFGSLKNALRENYQVINTPKKMDFVALSTSMRNVCLPMLVSLELNVGAFYEHVIGICPSKPRDGGETQFFIIDGAHPQLQAIEFSLDNLNWCCGGSNCFSVVNEGFFLCPRPKRTKSIVSRWSSKYKTKEDIEMAGVCVCLGVDKVKIPEHMRALNTVRWRIDEAIKIAKGN